MHKYGGVPVWAIVLIAVGGLCCMGSAVAVVATTMSTSLSTLEGIPSASATPEQSESAEQSEPAPTPEPEPEPEPQLTVAQIQAVGTAESYIRSAGFSRSGLIHQLEYEGFSEEDAAFAVDYIDVDWKEQAVRVAKSYLRSSNFSRQGLIDQLEYEGFTTKQAEHGANEVGL